MKQLHAFQEEALRNLRVSIGRGKRRPLIVSPTGAGKTVIASAVVQGAESKSTRVLFVVPRMSLIDQTVVRLGEDGITDVGVIQAEHVLTNWLKPVQVASIQTLSRRLMFLRNWRNEPGKTVVVIDEAHEIFQFYAQWMKSWSDVIFIGLTATPYTKGLGKLYDDMIIAETTRGLIDKKFLAPPRYFAPSHLDTKGIKKVAGDFHEGQLAERMDTVQITADIVLNWCEKAENRPTFVFAVNCAHAQNLCDAFKAAGVAAEYGDAHTSRLDREEMRKRFESGETKVICNVGILTTGIDWDVRCIVLARATWSRNRFCQMVGRGLRIAEGKTDCLVFDHTDTVQDRLGFVEDIIPKVLDDGKHAVAGEREEKEKPLPKPCPACNLLKPAGVRKCENCGFECKPQAKVEVLDGELVELDSSKKFKGTVSRQYSMFEKQQFYEELLGIQQMKGYRTGWAIANYKEKFGVMPQGMSELRAAPPSPTTLAWVSMKLRKWRLEQRRMG